MRYDVIPAVVSGGLANVFGDTVLGQISGPNKEEWAIGITSIFTLLVREVIWWLRHRNTPKV